MLKGSSGDGDFCGPDFCGPMGRALMLPSSAMVSAQQ
jgi:hypothetical protein